MSIVGAFPTTIKNGDLEDATILMSLFTFIQSQVNAGACGVTAGTSVLKGDGLGATAAATAGVDFVSPSINLFGPFRNRFINGNCYWDQRNSAAAQTITAAAALAYCIDRFYAYCTGANVTGQQIVATDSTKRYRFTGAASVTGIGFGHRIEAANSVDMAGNTCTFSVKLANSLLTTVSWAAYYANTADAFGTLAAPTRTAISSGSFTVNSVEAVYSAQIAVPSAATTGIEIVLTVGAQTSGTWTIGEVQFEKGATPAAAILFERVDMGVNLARCQRYYQVHTCGIRSYSPAAGAFTSSPLWYPVQMRTPPTVATISAGTLNGNAASCVLTEQTADYARVELLSSGVGDTYCTGRIFSLSAEL